MSLGTSFFDKIRVEQQSTSKDQQLSTKDQKLSTKDQKLSTKDQKLSTKDQKLMQKVWSASARVCNNRVSESSDSVSTGYDALDSLLSMHGWPLGVMTEIGLRQDGIGELRLLLPALRVLQQTTLSKRHIVWIAPPFTPLATSLLKEGLDIDCLTIVQPDNVKDVVWAYEQALLSGSCATVVAWRAGYQLSNKEIRRLQLAAEKSQSLSFLFRDEACLKQASASHLRLSLQTNAKSELELHILKQPQHWGDQRCTLSLHPHYEQWQRLPAELLPHSNQQMNQRNDQIKKRIGNNRQQTAASVSSLLKPAHLNSENTITHKRNFD